MIRTPSRPIACTTEQTVLGEGARCDGCHDELLRVDILAGRIYRDGGDASTRLDAAASTHRGWHTSDTRTDQARKTVLGSRACTNSGSSHRWLRKAA
jgi:hypothetical protein